MDTQHIQMAHGGGGQLTAELIEQVVLPALGGPQQAGLLADAAAVAVGGEKAAFTTDSYVVWPLEFPGGDIGKLAVCGTINDLAVCGARPVALSMGLIVQEGLEIALLKRVLASAGRTAAEAQVPIVTGDTKVVGRDALDGIIINTAGLGQLLPQAQMGFEQVIGGDKIVLSGPLGEHGLAIMNQRESLGVTGELASDCAALHRITAELLESLGDQVRFMRDLTRGGLATTIVDLAIGAGRDIEIDEAAIPVNRTAWAAAEILGLDLLTVANEGKLVAVVADAAADEAVKILAGHEVAAQAAVIGTVGPESASPLVEMITRIGGRRVVQMPYGEELPRIC